MPTSYIKFVGGGILAKLFERISFLICSNDISAKIDIKDNTRFHHRGLGCVVNSKVTIGENCTIFQNVTIGSRWKNGICEGGSPKIGDDVVIGAGAVLLGNITIGNNVHIGANAVVLTDVPDNCTVVGVPGKIINKEN